MRFWSRIKLGIIPLLVVGLLIFLVYKVGEIINDWGLHLVGNPLFDVPINVVIVLFATFLFGCLLEYPPFNNFAKENFAEIPIIGGLLLLLLLPKHELQLVEIRTVPGNTPEEENWEYAIITKELPVENGVRWYRVHTLGWTGKLFCRVSERSLRPTNRPDRDVWLSVFSMGLL